MKFSTVVFGCQMNLHDSERIDGILTSEGWEKVDDPQKAEVVVILTCCVRGSAEERFWGYLQSLKPLKKKGTVFAVGGCLAQEKGTAIFERAPHVDVVFGTHQYINIARLIRQSVDGPVCSLEMDGIDLSTYPMRRREHFRGWVPIIHGCNNFCSYCIVPYTRGREISRPLEEIMEEIDQLASEGVKEIVLLGQNVNSYGRDLYGRKQFHRLLKEVSERLPSVWIRFLTSHPRDFDKEIIKAISAHENICRYIHLPMQAGSDRILRRMNRGYDRDYYMKLVKTIREEIPTCSISTDIIVGFPGEGETDFQETLEAVERCAFDSAFTFIYNRREGTKAAKLRNEVPRQVVMDRFSRLTSLTDQLTFKSNLREVGSTQKILVEGRSKRNRQYMLKGRTSRNKVVNFQGEESLIGEFVQVEIVEAGKFSLIGKMRNNCEVTGQSKG